jgi:hypothetical protein
MWPTISANSQPKAIAETDLVAARAMDGQGNARAARGHHANSNAIVLARVYDS